MMRAEDDDLAKTVQLLGGVEAGAYTRSLCSST
jgi:hypothetical protein